MRIQHNITAMNAYRNYSNNTAAIGKNLEKLSSGYKINRAGDDAAGLAVSQKMRLQIAGLDQAQKNAKSGISYVQTAEGALQEVHQMLERMYTLAEQSANGTFDDSTDRTQLQKEVNNLMEEINRIGKTANFNGQGIFTDYVGGTGSSSGGASGGNAVTATFANDTISGAALVASTDRAQISAVDIGGAKLGATGYTVGNADGDTTNIKINIALDNGKTIEAYVGLKSNGTNNEGKGYYINADGEAKSVTIANLGTATAVKGSDLAAMTVAIVNAAQTNGDFGLDVNATTTAAVDGTNTNQVKLTGDTGKEAVGISNITIQINDTEVVNSAGSVVQTMTASTEKELDLSDLATEAQYDNNAAASTLTPDEATFSINGVKFAIAKNSASALDFGDDVNVYVTTAATGFTDADDGQALLNFINAKTGLGLEFFTPGTSTTNVVLKSTTGGASGGSGGSGAAAGDVSFWIGAEYFDSEGTAQSNKLTIKAMHLNVNNMSIDASGSTVGVNVDGNVPAGNLSGVDITDADKAMASLNAIKNASNAVSDMRGSLGAMQNRLEHTINNLSVMEENMQDAESVIRDTDVAKEMMAYTKNSILIQSAQAMLAQANQLPQGVLQLLQ